MNFVSEHPDPVVRELIGRIYSLEKEQQRILQNDSVLRTETSQLFKILDKKDKQIKDLYTICYNLIAKAEGIPLPEEFNKRIDEAADRIRSKLGLPEEE